MEEELKKIIMAAVREAIEEIGLTTSAPSDGYPEIMELKQAAEYIKLSAGHIKNAMETLKIPHKRAGTKYLFKKSELNRWVDERDEEKTPKVKIVPAKSKGSITRIV